MGSLNGTMLNSHAVHLTQSGSRNWSNPIELSSGDTITLGTSTKILVHKSNLVEFRASILLFCSMIAPERSLILQLLCEILIAVPFI